MRAGLIAMAFACLAAPAPSLAGGPAYTPIGPPATLNTFVFGADGTVYATVDTASTAVRPEPQGALWRSGDGGRTWSSRYRARSGARFVVLAVSPADANAVYASETLPKQQAVIERIDAVTGRVIPLPMSRLFGVDAAGTAYGLGSALVRCPRGADACNAVPLPSFGQYTIVDPKSVGVLVSHSSSDTAGDFIQTSSDGGATWTQGAPLSRIYFGKCDAACPLAFAGPEPRTLYGALGEIVISHDAGLTWSQHTPRPINGGLTVGSSPAVVLFNNGPTMLFTSDGVNLRSVNIPSPVLAVDPNDANHFFLQGDYLQGAYPNRESWDGGQSWSDLLDKRFGTLPFGNAEVAGAGTHLYAAIGYALWSSDDSGATWRRTSLTAGTIFNRILVSRDDPLTAYAWTADTTNDVTELRTRDGGRNWQPLVIPDNGGVQWLAPGDPLHIFSSGGAPSESSDGGATWTYVAHGEQCTFTAVADATSPTGQRLLCDGWRSYDPLRPLAAGPLPYAQGLRGSPDAPGAYAILGDKLLGDAQNDWSWTSLLGATGGIGPGENAVAIDAWPTRNGTTFIAEDLKGYWVRRGTGRWWRLQAFGAGLAPTALLDSSHLVVRPAGPLAQPAVLDLSIPAVAPPAVQPSAGGLTCAVAWRPEDAEAAAYAWRRDGTALRGATSAQYRLGALDAGHEFTCEVTARNGWGSVVLASPLAYLAPGVRAQPARPRLTGKPRVGALLRCSAGARLTWFRDGRAVSGRHGRTYLVRARDAGHAIACQTRLADGKRLRSPGLRIARRPVSA